MHKMHNSNVKSNCILGSILTLVSNGNCYNLKAKWADRISSVDSGGRCLVIWDRIDCEGRTATLSSSAEKDFENLERIGFDKRIRSVQLCTTPLAEVVNQEDEEKDSPEMEKDENESEEKNQRKSKDRSIEMPKSDSRSDDGWLLVLQQIIFCLKLVIFTNNLKFPVWCFAFQNYEKLHLMNITSCVGFMGLQILNGILK